MKIRYMALLGLILLTACGPQANNAGGENSPPAAEVNEKPVEDHVVVEPASGAAAGVVNLSTFTNEDIQRAHREAHPNWELTALVYEVGKGYFVLEGREGDQELNLRMDALTGEISQGPTDQEDDDEDGAMDLAALAPWMDAVRGAEEELKGNFVALSLEEDDGQLIYEVKLDNGREIAMDAQTLKVLEADQ
ncbi:MAG: PepSY domain-containing protein [Tissierellia bacterium]|nr:PepSY domain-containing protein [Tissierellia bacterium]